MTDGSMCGCSNGFETGFDQNVWMDNGSYTTGQVTSNCPCDTGSSNSVTQPMPGPMPPPVPKNDAEPLTPPAPENEVPPISEPSAGDPVTQMSLQIPYGPTHHVRQVSGEKDETPEPLVTIPSRSVMHRRIQ